MTMVFVVCAALGGSVLVLQFVLTLVGLGGEAFDLDLPDQVDTDVDLNVDADFDSASDFDSHAGDHVSSSWMFGVVSFRTVVAALAFFGLAGLAGQSGGLPTTQTLLIAIAAGAAAMYGVYWMMRGLKHLKAEGTARIERAVGRHASVYVTVPAEEAGTGKIQINLQQRTMEYLALTDGEAIKPGTKVVVTDVITSDTVKVHPVLE